MEYKNLIGGAITDKISIYNCDCMELLKQTPDNYYSLALVDPPYGINKDGTIGFATKKTKGFSFTKKEYTRKDWDSTTPNIEYFNELKRVSKNQIIWGANYMTNEIGVLKNFICWYKKGQSKDEKFNECELAYTSLGLTKMIDIWWNGFGTINSGEIKTHPTQKPVKLYRWILDNYAKENDKILDTHLGSGSIAIACHDYGFDLTACELDKEYFDKAMERINNHVAQQKLF